MFSHVQSDSWEAQSAAQSLVAVSRCDARSMEGRGASLCSISRLCKKHSQRHSKTLKHTQTVQLKTLKDSFLHQCWSLCTYGPCEKNR